MNSHHSILMGCCFAAAASLAASCSSEKSSQAMAQEELEQEFDLPPGARGFRGEIEGTCLNDFAPGVPRAYGESGDLMLAVERVISVSEGNKAASPQALAGRRVAVSFFGRALPRAVRQGDKVTLSVSHGRWWVHYPDGQVSFKADAASDKLRFERLTSHEIPRPLLPVFCYSSIFLPVLVVALAAYGLILQFRSRTIAVACACVSGVVTAGGFLFIGFYKPLGGLPCNLGGMLFVDSFVLPVTVSGLVACWLALRTTRKWVAFLVGLIVSPIVAVLTVRLICHVSLLYLEGMRFHETTAVGLDFALLIPRKFYLVFGWPILAIIIAGLCAFLVGRRLRMDLSVHRLNQHEHNALGRAPSDDP